jgi:hypothetical protein
MALAAPVILWGADAPSDKLRQCARCTACGNRGATLMGAERGRTDFAEERAETAERKLSDLRIAHDALVHDAQFNRLVLED